MQAIITRYHGPTNTRGSRIVAHCEGGRVTHSLDHSLNIDGNHEAAAMELARRLGWEGEWYASYTNNGRVWVNITQAALEPHHTFTIPRSIDQ